MPRFKIGDCVRILPTDPGPFANLAAMVQQVHPQQQNIETLDRYVVVFDWGEEQTFYDAQLENAVQPKP